MQIARTIRRVKRQAREGGLGALRVSLGEELRSSAIPSPLRPAARRLAALLDPGRSRASSQQTPAALAQSSLSSARGGDGGDGEEARRSASVYEPAPSAEPASADSSAVPLVSTATDSGAQPVEPAADTQVDARVVGATPTVNATPVEAQAVDASPVEVSVVDATPTAVAAVAEVALAPGRAAEAPSVKPTTKREAGANAEADQPASKAQAAGAGNHGKPRTPKPRKAAPETATPERAAAKKEKLAPSGEAAKSLARSGSRGAKQRSGGSNGTTSKKK